MDYFSVIVLIIVTFVFVSDRSVRTIQDIQKTKTDIDIVERTNNIKSNMEIIDVESKDMSYEKIFNLAQKSTKEYILIKNKKLNLDEYELDIMIANYIVANKRPCGFNLLYEYQGNKWSFKKLYIDIINYLNIFNKSNLATYGILISSKNDYDLDEKKFKKKLVSYTPAEFTHIQLTKQEISTSNVKKIYITKLAKSNISITLKILLLIISGSIITTNLIYSILNVNNNLSSIIVAAVIYYCYSYIIRYIYKPIGKKRVIATYLFPIYFVSYVIVIISAYISRVIKKVHAS